MGPMGTDRVHHIPGRPDPGQWCRVPEFHLYSAAPVSRCVAPWENKPGLAPSVGSHLSALG